MVKVSKVNTVEDQVFVAERQYNCMMENVKNGVIDQTEVVIAMNMLNRAHWAALSQNKRHLL